MNSHRILVVRNDKLGDFMLAWPAIRVLKECLPDARIFALVPAYTAPLAQLCPWIDEVVIDPGKSGTLATLELARMFRRLDLSGALTLFSTTRIGLALWLARIPLRMAPATKIAQLFYNRRIHQRRSRSEKPEFAYNFDLAEALLQEIGGCTATVPQGPYLQFPVEASSSLATQLRAELGLQEKQRLIFVHPGSGGSANNLTIAQYAELCRHLDSAAGHGFVITYGLAEAALAQQLFAALEGLPRHLLAPTGLEALARHLQVADLFISGSTGPLHIAGALDRPTAAFYPGHRSGSKLRWQTLNRPEHRLAFSAEVGEMDLSGIDVAAAAEAISRQFLCH